MLSGYVDDGRQITSTIAPGMRFDGDQYKFIHNSEGLKEDRERQSKGETTNQRMARVCLPAMEAINPDLKFTTESQEENPNERLPTLDFSMWINEDNVVQHTCY